MLASGSWWVEGSGVLFATFLDPTAGSWDIDGFGAVSHDNPWTLPTPPIVIPGGSQTPPGAPQPQNPTPGQPVIRHVSETMPDPDLDARGYPVDWEPQATTDEELGTIQIVIEGQDVTNWADTPTPLPTYQRGEPFGAQAAHLPFPQITAWQSRPSWAKAGANVQILFVPIVGEPQTLWRGILLAESRLEPDGEFGFDALGLAFQADQQLRPPAFDTAPQDIGILMAEVLNSTIGRRFGETLPVYTGILTSVAGSWEPRLTGFIQRLLATAITNGEQWTVACDDQTPEIRLKDRTTITWEITVGQRGIDVDVDLDGSADYNAIYGEGTNPEGGSWRNARYPNWHPDDTPPYPYTNPATLIGIGTTDAMTDTGTGVSTWEAKVGVAVDGTFSMADSARLREMQRQAGIQIDGSLGPQSWAMTFDTGANTGDLSGAFIAPLAYLPQVEPCLYGPDGDILGANPDFDPSVLRNERKIDFGQGVTIEEGRRAAAEILARDSVPGQVGTVTFELDPPQLSRFLLKEGQNGIIRDLHGQDVTVHVATVDVDGDIVTLGVDEKARDYPTLDAIRLRERSATDPAQAAHQRLVQGIVASDRPTFDADSPAGIVPRHAIYSNLWDVRRIPFGSYGSITRSEITTSGPARAFALAVFGRPVTAAGLLTLVGNPLTAAENPWEIDEPGLLMAWGWKEQPCGYWPKTYSNPGGESGAPVTGRLVDDSWWQYASDNSPWLWVATIASGACYVEGRFYPGAN